MKRILLIAMVVFAGPALATVSDLKKCSGSFVISSDGAATESLDSLLKGATNAGFLESRKISSTRLGDVYQIRASSAETLDSAISVLEVAGQLNGVIVECDSVVGID